MVCQLMNQGEPAASVIGARCATKVDARRLMAYDGYPVDLPPLTQERIAMYFDAGLIVVGPVERPGRPGCARCLLNRRLSTRPHADIWLQLQTEGLLPSLDSELLENHVGLSDLVTACLEELIHPSPDSDVLHYYTVRVDDGTVTLRRLEPDPLCRRCGDLPLDRPSKIPSAPILKRERVDTRAGVVQPEELLSRYVDDYAGLISRVEVGEEAGLQVARAPVGIRGSLAVEAGWGRSTSAQGAQVTAVLEALERWCGLAPGRVAAAGTWTFDEVRRHALDIRTTGTPFEEGYGRRITPFREDTPCRWVWAKSVTEEDDVLVPEGLAYYGNALVNVGDPRFVYEISNGCALGGSLTEAALFGALEVVERDALLLAWYTRAPLDRLRFTTALPATQQLWSHLETSNDCRIVAWDLASPVGLPAVWVMAVRDDPGGVVGRSLAKSVSASSCRATYDEALVSALCELGPILTSVDGSYSQHSERVESMLVDPSQVKEMSDHALLYAHPSAFSRFDHLDSEDSPGGVDIKVRDAVCALDLDVDLVHDFENVLTRLVSAGLPRALVVDQTATELNGSELYCAKVIIPGAIPMTFGHVNRRLTGLPRLDAMLDGSEVNPYPHPFP